MSGQPPRPSEPDPDDPIGVRFPNTARIWNYQLGGKDNFAVDRQASDAANAMVRGLGVPAGTPSPLTMALAASDACRSTSKLSLPPSW